MLRVSIPQYEEIEEGRVAFKVNVQYAKLSWAVWRRFSDFAALHDQLLTAEYAALPALPPKTLLPSATDTKFLEKRKNKLFNYLQELLRRPDTRTSEELLTFLSLTEQASVLSKSVRPVVIATTGPQRCAVSSMVWGLGFIVAGYEDKTSMSRLGRLWTLVEPDELGILSVWCLDGSSKLFSSPFTQKQCNKVRCLAFHAESKRIIMALDDGSLEALELSSEGTLKPTAKAELHAAPIVGLSAKSNIFSAAADGSIRLVDGKSLKIISGGRLTTRLGNHSLTCSVYDEATYTAILGTSAGVVLCYSLKTTKPAFIADMRLIPNNNIDVIISHHKTVFAAHGPHISVLTLNPQTLIRGAVLNLRDCEEYVHSLCYDYMQNRLFAGYKTFICWWCLERGECLLAWEAHNGGVYSLLMPEGGEALISGGDSGTIKVWQLPAAASLTPWTAAPPHSSSCCLL